MSWVMVEYGTELVFGVKNSLYLDCWSRSWLGRYALSMFFVVDIGHDIITRSSW